MAESPYPVLCQPQCYRPPFLPTLVGVRSADYLIEALEEVASGSTFAAMPTSWSEQVYGMPLRETVASEIWTMY